MFKGKSVPGAGRDQWNQCDLTRKIRLVNQLPARAETHDFSRQNTPFNNFNVIYGRPQDQMPAKLRLRDTLASIHQTRGAAFTWRPLQKMYGYKSLSPVLIFHQSEYCILAFFGKYWLLNWHEIDIQIRFPFTRFNLPPEWVLINFAFEQILANWHDRFAAICTTKARTATDMDGTLHTDLWESESSREIRKSF